MAGGLCLLGKNVPDVEGDCYFPTYGPLCEHTMAEQAPYYFWYRIINGVFCVTLFLLSLLRNYTLNPVQTPLLQRFVLRATAFASLLIVVRVYDPLGIISVPSWKFSRLTSDAATATVFSIVIVMAGFNIAIARMGLSKSLFTPTFRRLVGGCLVAMVTFIMATGVWKNFCNSRRWTTVQFIGLAVILFVSGVVLNVYGWSIYRSSQHALPRNQHAALPASPAYKLASRKLRRLARVLILMDVVLCCTIPAQLLLAIERMNSGQFTFQVGDYVWRFSMLYIPQVLSTALALGIYWAAPSRTGSLSSGLSQWPSHTPTASSRNSRYVSGDVSTTVYEALGDRDGPAPDSDEETDQDWADGTEALVEDYAASLWRSFRFSSSTNASSRATSFSTMSSGPTSHQYRPPSALEMASAQGAGVTPDGRRSHGGDVDRAVVDVF